MTQAQHAVTAVIFDWGGTLTPWHTIHLAKQRHVFARTHAVHPGMRDDEATRLADRIILAEEAAWQRARQDGGSARIAETLGEVGLLEGAPGLEEAHCDHEEFWEPHTLLYEDVPAPWRGLRERGIRVGVLSNTIWTREYHEREFARDGVRAEDVQPDAVVRRLAELPDVVDSWSDVVTRGA